MQASSRGRAIYGKPHILIVDDEPGIRSSLSFVLKSQGLVATAVESLAAANAVLEHQQPAIELIVLDLGLPDGCGDQLLRRPELNPIPVIVLTSRDQEIDRVVLLELGADDFVGKPFSPREMVARIRAVLRRSQRTAPAVAGGDTESSTAAQTLVQGPFILCPDKRTLRVDGKIVPLTRLEFDLLHTLLRRPGYVFTRRVLLDLLWPDTPVTDRTVDVHIKQLRQKLGEAAEFVGTVHGVGYRLRE